VFLDDDVIPPPSGVVRLHMDALPIVSGVYPMRRPPELPMVMRRKDRAKPWDIEGGAVDWDCDFAKNHPRNELVQVDAIPLGFCFILREVFEEIPPPWFKFTEHYGEDCYFSWKASRNGFRLYVDTSVCCHHIVTKLLGEGPPPGWKWQKAFVDAAE
jgi:hypothetical protein